MPVNNDAQLPRISSQPAPSPLPEGQTSVHTGPGVQEADLKQTLDWAGKQLEDVLAAMKNQAPSVHFAGPPGKNDPPDKGKLTTPKPPKVPDDADEKQMQAYQKKMSDYTSMMQTIANVLRMMEQMSKNLMGNIR